MTLFQTRDELLGVIRLELWDEGYILWIGGEIAWKSWDTKFRFGRKLAADPETLERLKTWKTGAGERTHAKSDGGHNLGTTDVVKSGDSV